MENDLRELKENEVFVLMNDDYTGTNIFAVSNDKMNVIKAFTEISSKDELILNIVNTKNIPPYRECYSNDSITNRLIYNDICRLTESYVDCYIVISSVNNEILIKGFIQIIKLNQAIDIFRRI